MDQGRLRCHRGRGNLTAGAKTGDFDSITRLAKQFVEKVKEARGQ